MSIGTGTTRRRARPAPRTALLLLGHLPLTGVNVTVLNVVALDQARRLAAEEMRAGGENEFGGVGEFYLFYLDQATETAWTYAALLAVAGAITLVLTWTARRHGVTAPLLAGLGVFGIPFFLLLLMVTMGMPFWLSGATGEPVPLAIGDGPPWYLPALVTQTSLAAVAYVASVALMLRGRGRHPARGRPPGEIGPVP